MPLSKNVGKNIKELYADNKKKGKARGAEGKKRSRKQIIAIALSAAGKSRKKIPSRKNHKSMSGEELLGKAMKHYA